MNNRHGDSSLRSFARLSAGVPSAPPLVHRREAGALTWRLSVPDYDLSLGELPTSTLRADVDPLSYAKAA